MSEQREAGRRAVSALARLKYVILAGAAGLASCTPSVPITGADPSNPNAPVARVGYRSTVTGYTSQRPAEPGPWIEQNQRVAPQSQDRR